MFKCLRIQSFKQRQLWLLLDAVQIVFYEINGYLKTGNGTDTKIQFLKVSIIKAELIFEHFSSLKIY